ncbi:MAG: phosphotriesterase [Dehalococcoidia bacterium]|nr:MAG: phosphotriesterase [Dehalococcoidia bacterium]
MVVVQTVLGPVAPEQLGPTLMHEHLIFGVPGWQDDPFITWDRPAVTDVVIAKVREAKGLGLGTLVDVTAIGVTRDIALMQEVARATGVAIVAATGWWVASGITSYFAEKAPEELARIMVYELTIGMKGSGARAGIIKVGTSLNEMHPAEMNVLRAAGRAQAETGCAITTHTTGATLGNEQLDVLTSSGARAERVIIGHSDDRLDLDYHRSLLERGAMVEFDHLGSRAPGAIPDEAKAHHIARLVAEGYAGQLLLSHDWVGDVVTLPGYGDLPQGQRSLGHLFSSFVPLLREAGVSNEAIETMVVANPARLLAF